MLVMNCPLSTRQGAVHLYYIRHLSGIRSLKIVKKLISTVKSLFCFIIAYGNIYLSTENSSVLGVRKLKRKKILSLIGILIVTSLCASCSNSAALDNSSKHSWEVTSNLPDYSGGNISGFLNKKQAITVGDSGYIYYTKDGGKTWNQGKNSSLCLFGLTFVNSKVAYASGNGGYVIKTTDGGANWKPVSGFGEGEPNHPRYLSFLDENTGWVATVERSRYKNKEVMLGSTKDGGKTWEGIVLPDEAEDILAIHLRTPENGYVLDSKKNLYITKDGGKSFSRQPLNIEDIELMVSFSQQIILKFSDENNAFIAYKDNSAKLKAARSSDGGKTWISETIPDSPIGALHLSQDGKLITLTRVNKPIKILEYK
jgi:photosystem II stability/assembly factor-like uncharacterized protein